MLKLSGVETGYGKLKVLRGIDMEVPTGKIVALLGGNGTGKSTLLKAISGLLPTWEGRIEFDGQLIVNKKPHEIVRSGLTQVTQGKDTYPGMTVGENLQLGAFSRNDKAGVAADLEKVYGYFPRLKERCKQMAGTLSGGEVQMLVIGRGLMAGPKLIMLDEPSAAVIGDGVEDWQELNFENMVIDARIDGSPPIQAYSDVYRRHPVDIMAETINGIRQRGFNFEPGMFLLTGSLTLPTPFRKGQTLTVRHGDHSPLSLTMT